jgi:hypothetical protein
MMPHQPYFRAYLEPNEPHQKVSLYIETWYPIHVTETRAYCVHEYDIHKMWRVGQDETKLQFAKRIGVGIKIIQRQHSKWAKTSHAAAIDALRTRKEYRLRYLAQERQWIEDFLAVKDFKKMVRFFSGDNYYEDSN